MINTGFTYAGAHSSRFGIVCDPTTRIIFPEKRRMITDIAGRSGVHMHTDGTYLARQESFHCYFVKPAGKTVAESARDIAAWLSSDGVLQFDNEPDKYYDAFVSGALPQERHLKYGEFDLLFTYSPPFAYTAMKQVLQVITASGGSIACQMDGTVDTPVRIIIRNTGNTIIQNMRVSRKVN